MPTFPQAVCQSKTKIQHVECINALLINSLIHICLASVLWDIGKKTQIRCRKNAASGQDLHCLLTEVSFKIKIVVKNTTQQPWNWKCARPNDKDGKMHSA